MDFIKGELSQRLDLLEKLECAIKDHANDISQALSMDLGRTDMDNLLLELRSTYEEIRFMKKHLPRWIQPQAVATPATLWPAKSFLWPRPKGRVLVIAPWNYPFLLSVKPAINAIAAGCTVVIKPSELTPSTSQLLSTILGPFSPNLVVQQGGVDETQVLLKENFDHIFFTGSTRVGRIVMKHAAENLTPVSLELGGKSPVWIDRNCNLEVAAKRIAWAKFINAGQTCIAPDYVLVPIELKERFVLLLKKSLNTMFAEGIQKIVNREHLNRLLQLMQNTKILFQGEKISASHVPPTLVSVDSINHPIMQEEIFGPILPIMGYNDVSIAETMIWKNPLAFYIFTDNKPWAKELIRRHPSGGVCINDAIIHNANPYLPFGGIGQSGIGSYGGLAGFLTFSHMQPVLENSTRMDLGLRYPPFTRFKQWLIRHF